MQLYCFPLLQSSLPILMNISNIRLREIWKPLALCGAIVFLYASVFLKLAADWLNDPNYSHGAIVPFVIAYIIWLDFHDLSSTARKSEYWTGLLVVLLSLFLVLTSTLAAELYVQRLSFVLLCAGVVIYFFGTKVLAKLVVPFALFLFSIPIPQIVFNKIANPLQMLASRAADRGIKLAGIASVRKGNVIDIVPAGQTAKVALEVVEACSGIRSLMTLVTLALILGYFTRQRRGEIRDGWFGFWSKSDVWRTLLLILSAIPIALVTNGGRVMITGITTFHYGQQAAEGFWHEAAGWLVFIAAFALLMLLNAALIFLQRRRLGAAPFSERGHTAGAPIQRSLGNHPTPILFLVVTLVLGGVVINWFQQRSELTVDRRPLAEIPLNFGDWQSKGDSFRFDSETEKVLRADDYVMRYYFSPATWVNFYVGYYGSQRSGASYHSPQNCLPGSGWELTDPGSVKVQSPGHEGFIANKYIVRRGGEQQILIYWYQGRGRSTASEYKDKIFTSIDSIMRRRTDGAIVRIMAPVGTDKQRSLEYLMDFASRVSGDLSAYVPD